MVIVVFFILQWYLSLFTQTFFHHRYAAHRMFTMSNGWEKFFYFLSWIFQGSSYLSPYAYGILHRMHHAHADTELDPHSPIYSKNLFDMMWKTRTIYTNIISGKANIDPKFTRNVPRWDAMEYIADSWPSRIGWGLFYVAIYILFCHHWYLWALLPIQFLMSPVHGAIINWFAHKFGYVSYPVSDTSRNLLPVDFLMLGESYHNNHHKFGGRANFGVRWFELDPIYPIIKLFNKLHIIKLKTNNDLNYM
jgi:stearoyl-CoA desaturase (delta-9 desaturase)